MSRHQTLKITLAALAGLLLAGIAHAGDQATLDVRVSIHLKSQLLDAQVGGRNLVQSAPIATPQDLASARIGCVHATYIGTLKSASIEGSPKIIKYGSPDAIVEGSTERRPKAGVRIGDFGFQALYKAAMRASTSRTVICTSAD